MLQWTLGCMALLNYRISSHKSFNRLNLELNFLKNKKIETWDFKLIQRPKVKGGKIQITFISVKKFMLKKDKFKIFQQLVILLDIFRKKFCECIYKQHASSREVRYGTLYILS